MAEPRIVVTKDGPYRVEGGVPLLRTAIVKTEHGEPVDWDEGPAFETTETYELCRCGNSSTKPFCDSTHERVAFDGRETADRGPIEGRREAWEGEAGLALHDDTSLCTHAGFCRNRRTGVWEMLDQAADESVRSELLAMVGRCPSGRLAVTIAAAEAELVEPVFEPSIGVEPDASLWIRGGIPVVSQDGSPYEVRNRQTLCRCGRSGNKPFCDGAHRQHLFTDPAMPR